MFSKESGRPEVAKFFFQIMIAIVATIPFSSIAEPSFRISHVRPLSSAADNDIRGLTYEISNSTNIKFTIFPDSSLGDFISIQRKLRDGSVDIALQPVSTEQDNRFKIGNLPYLVDDWKDAKSKFGKAGNIRKAVEDLFQQQGIQLLAVYPQYFGGVSLAKSPITTEKATIKVRVPKSQDYMARVLGYQPVDLAFTDIKKSFKAKLIDGIIGSGAEGYYGSFLEYTKYYVVANTHFEVWYLLMNKKKFDDLSQKYKDEFWKAATYFEALRWSRAEVLQAFNEKRLRDSDVVIIRPTKQELERMTAEGRKIVWPQIVDQIGKPYVEKVLGGIK